MRVCFSNHPGNSVDRAIVLLGSESGAESAKCDQQALRQPKPGWGREGIRTLDTVARISRPMRIAPHFEQDALGLPATPPVTRS